MINTADLKNTKPPEASMKPTSQEQIEQLYITAKTDLLQKNYANQFKDTLESKMRKHQLHPYKRFTNKYSGLSTHSSYPTRTDSYTRKINGFIPLTEKQKFIGK